MFDFVYVLFILQPGWGWTLHGRYCSVRSRQKLEGSSKDTLLTRRVLTRSSLACGARWRIRRFYGMILEIEEASRSHNVSLVDIIDALSLNHSA